MNKKPKLLTRREFVKQGLTFASVGFTAPTFLTRVAFGSEQAQGFSEIAGTSNQRVLVVVQLSGGNDGLNTIVPYRNDVYYRLRPNLAIQGKDVLALHDEFGVHPDLAGFKELYEDEKLAIIQGVGYPNPDRSHFRSMEIWESAVSDDFESTGWIGRLFDHSCNNQPGNTCSPTLGINVGHALSPALRGESGVGVAVNNPEQLYQMTRLSTNRGAQETMSESGENGVGAKLDFLRRTAMNAELSADRIRQSVRKVQAHAHYPENEFAQGLKLIAGMIAGGLDTQVYYIALPGFDTHAGQKGVHKRLLSILGDSIAAFQRDLAGLGQEERVLGMVFSEFGRRVAENGSLGTDHGQAAPMFMFGRSVRPGFVGRHPNLQALADGDLRFGIDFRSIYAAVLEDWLAVESQVVLGARFDKIAIIS